MQLAWQDHAVIVIYLIAMVALGGYFSRGQKGNRDYFLAGRSMPWFAVGVSVIASLLSSLTYLSEPGEVWKSGITNIFGKMLAIPFEMVVVWCLLIPFMMRFRYTSAYEYLGDRFGKSAQRFGVAMFLCMVTLWMGFVVLASAQALAKVSGFNLLTIIVVIGIVATLYTMLGGLRAVIWTDVVQVALLTGGGLFTLGYVVYATGSWLPDWYSTAQDYLASQDDRQAMPIFSFDPRVRATVVTVAINMCVWHICTHVASQITVQRYFSTTDMKAARRSFVTGSLFGVGINLMLASVGLALMHFYLTQEASLPTGIDPATKDRDLIFPTFALSKLTPGVGGAILAALLAAAMSSIDSGINSIATVLSVEMGANEDSAVSHVRTAKKITLIAGVFVTLAAYSLSYLPDQWGIVGAMPRTFNAITAPMGGIFLVGIFLPWVGQRAAIAGAICGLITSISLGYLVQFGSLLQSLGVLSGPLPEIGFTWVMPTALFVTIFASGILGVFARSDPTATNGLTWQSSRGKDRNV